MNQGGSIMTKKILNRSEIDINTTWDLTHIFKDSQEFTQALDAAVNDVFPAGPLSYPSNCAIISVT